MAKRQTPEETLKECTRMVIRAVQKTHKFKTNKKYLPTESQLEQLYTLCLIFSRGHKEMLDLFARLLQRSSGHKEIGPPAARKALKSRSRKVKKPPGSPKTHRTHLDS